MVGFVSVAVRAAALLPQLCVGALPLFQRLLGGLHRTTAPRISRSVYKLSRTHALTPQAIDERLIPCTTLIS